MMKPKSGDAMKAFCGPTVFILLTTFGIAQTGDESSADFSVKAFCSRTHPGMPVARIVWKVSQHSGESAPAPQFVDVTTDKIGFERKDFVTIWPKTEGNPAASRMSGGSRQLDPLRSLTVPAPREAKPAVGKFVLQPEGLQAGVNYFWRLRTRTVQGWKNVTVETTGPVCPIDSHR